MVDKLMQHKHCGMCGKAIPSSDELCSDECKTDKEAMMKKRKMYMYMMYGAIIIMMAFLMIQLIMSR